MTFFLRTLSREFFKLSTKAGLVYKSPDLLWFGGFIFVVGIGPEKTELTQSHQSLFLLPQYSQSSCQQNLYMPKTLKKVP